jgi:hypothetical protein
LSQDEEQALQRVVKVLSRNGFDVSDEELLLLLVKAASSLPDQELLDLVNAGLDEPGVARRCGKKAT